MIETIKKILLVDDEIEFVNTLRRHLKREGFLICSASDGKDACREIKTAAEKAEREQVDLVITDVIMPQMNGIELLQRIKDEFRQISVLIITGFGNEAAAVCAVRPEMDAYAKKPITPETLMQCIAEIDQKRRIARNRETKTL